MNGSIIKETEDNMAKYVLCKKCKRSIEKVDTSYTEGGTTYSAYICPHCGHLESTTISHIHYGNDGLK